MSKRLFQNSLRRPEAERGGARRGEPTRRYNGEYRREGSTEHSRRRSRPKPGWGFETAPKSGFTLLELTVVIVVLAILTVTIAPQFTGSYREAILRGAASDLTAVLNLASSQAVTTGRPHRLRFDGAEKRYWLEVLGADESGARYRPVRDLPGASGELHHRLSVRLRLAPRSREERATGPAPKRFLTPPGVVEFRPDATADAVEILISDEESTTLALRVNPYTSRVRLVSKERFPGGR